MKKITRRTVLLLILFISISIVLFRFNKDDFAVSNNDVGKMSKVCFGNNCFQVELAISPKQKQQGLMLRGFLDQNQGMLFVYEKEGRYSFWMKNTLIPLDMIWINNENKIVFIEKNVQPCKNIPCPSIDPEADAKYVLELNAGKSQEIGLAVGDQVSIEY